MHFDASISVVIGNKKLQTVVSVHSSNESAQLGAECDLVVPLNCRIQYLDGKHDYLTAYAKTLFNVGDPITIKARYDGYDDVTVFEGYVFDFVEGNPMTIKCTDYVYLLNQTTVDVHYKSITLKDLAKVILKDTGITLMEPTMDLTLQNITFRLMSPAAILEWLKKEIGINISLSGKQLYINVASNTLNRVIYRTDRNVIKCDLQKPNATYQKHKVKAWFVRENGTKDSYEVGDSNGTLHEVFFYKVKRNEAIYKNLAGEALLKVKQRVYSGTIETLLYPDCQLFDKAKYTDIRYPERSGNYVITGINFEIGDNGYHRKIKLAFLSAL